MPHDVVLRSAQLRAKRLLRALGSSDAHPQVARGLTSSVKSDGTFVMLTVALPWERAQPGTAEGEKFEVLTTLVDAYEHGHLEIPTPDPVEAIRFRMDQERLTTKDLLPIFKTRARASEVMRAVARMRIDPRGSVLLGRPDDAAITRRRRRG